MVTLHRSSQLLFDRLKLVNCTEKVIINRVLQLVHIFEYPHEPFAMQTQILRLVLKLFHRDRVPVSKALAQFFPIFFHLICQVDVYESGET